MVLQTACVLLTICSTAVGQSPGTPHRAARASEIVLWSDNFDDGDISDWTIENPTSGNSTVTMELTDAEYQSSPNSFWVSGQQQDYYGGRATGPEFNCSLDPRYTIRFAFRHGAFHWYYLVVFGPVKVVFDYAHLQLQYWNTGGHSEFGRADWSDYCPAGQWNQVRIEVDPQNTQYELFLNDTSVGTADYDPGYDSGARGFTFIESGGDAPAEADYIVNGYYDDISISIFVQPGDLNGDDVLNGKDIQGFVNELVKSDDSQRICAADLDGDLDVDTDDIPPFVTALLTAP